VEDLEYKDNVKFGALRSSYDNCICEGCHRGGYVTMLDLPSTLYHNGRKLSTKYRSYWLCDSCLEKLKAAINS